ncbi:hypothetical protein HGRIS_008104 [Hohenbuehelia grisea]|uniref:F-box domain-containing protein n=1 Tax=Hohenbuehelia grisea TaxID=104357 RepID=A0ABR3J749_9AGAR
MSENADFARTTSSSPFDALPLEVIHEIFERFDIPSLSVCKTVCRFFNTLIETNVNLQYKIELYAAGQEDGPAGSILPAQRLEMLRAHQKAWSSLDWQMSDHVPMATGGLWELYGNILSQFEADGSLKFMQLPSKLRGVPKRQWSIKELEFSPRDFGLDPSQDLLVLFENPRWQQNDRYLRIHIRTMSTGKTHPLAPKPGYLMHQEGYVELRRASYTIQISGTYIGFLCSGAGAWPHGRHELTIQNWKTGEIMMSLFGGTLRSYAFLGDHHIITVGLRLPEYDDIILQVHDLRTTPKTRESYPANCAFDFELPEFQARLPEVLIRADPAPSWTPPDGDEPPFFLARKNRLFVITFFALPGELHGQNLFVPSTTFFQALDSCSPDDGPIPWSQWGPNGTRLTRSNAQLMSVWVCYVHGMKFIEFDASEEDEALVMYDFNPMAVRRGLHTRNTVYDSEYTVPIHGPHPPLDIAPGVFREEVETLLPFLQVRRPVPTTLEHAMCSEDSLVLVDSEERSYRVLTF